METFTVSFTKSLRAESDEWIVTQFARWVAGLQQLDPALGKWFFLPPGEMPRLRHRAREVTAASLVDTVQQYLAAEVNADILALWNGRHDRRFATLYFDFNKLSPRRLISGGIRFRLADDYAIPATEPQFLRATIAGMADCFDPDWIVATSPSLKNTAKVPRHFPPVGWATYYSARYGLPPELPSPHQKQSLRTGTLMLACNEPYVPDRLQHVKLVSNLAGTLLAGDFLRRTTSASLQGSSD